MMSTEVSQIRPGQTVHLMGICGTAMASLAGLLKDRGIKVTGSDQNPYPPMSTQLENLGISVMAGYRPENLSHKPDLVIVGNVISKSNPEAQELLRLNLPFTSLPKALGEWVIDQRQSLVVSGTHGKTTTTSLLAWVAETVGVQPGFLIGGIPKNFSLSFRNPHGDYFVIEGDEYDTAYFDKVPKFIHYRPKHVILTSIEFDHADIYADLQAVKDAFRRLIELIPEDGTLLYNGKDANIRELLQYGKVKKKISYSNNKSDYMAKVVSRTSEGTVFQVFHGPIFMGEFFIAMTGDYNVMNATSVIGLADQLGWPVEGVREGLASFQGVRRRQEIIGEPRGITIIEDFAHHPTAVRETIQAIETKYAGRKVFSVFEPRSATSRRRVFQKEYVLAFKKSQEVLIAEAYDQGKIEAGDRFSSAELVADLVKEGCLAHSFSGADAIVDYLGEKAKPNDVILIMSNGGFDGIYQKLMTRLSR
jgi:UDP-N-acetylmuramate: L-alanyl-gamma-D-glutamyl-meso-diaminopimelate ligase